MDVDAKKQICGVRPVLLKHLLRKDLFDTPTAMKQFGLDEPHVTDTLRRLERSAWISFAGTQDGIDTWRPADRGVRLTATRLLKRISVAEGRAILSRFLEEARAINAEASWSRRVRRVLLFGSLLSNSDKDTIGDVDVEVQIERRALPKEVLTELEDAEKSPKRTQRNFIDSLCWPETRVLQRLRKVSRYISLHPESDLNVTGARCREVYVYDVVQERELEPEPKIEAVTVSQEPDISTNQDVARAGRRRRRWPPAPKRSVAIELADEDGRLVQHLWMNNLDLRRIGVRLRLRPTVVQAYLAARDTRRARPAPATFACLRATVLAALPKKRAYWTTVRLTWRQGHEVVFDIDAFDSRSRHPARLRHVGNRYRIFRARPDLLLALEDVDSAVAAWFDKARSRWQGLGVEVRVVCAPFEKNAAFREERFVDLRPLREPMLALLKQAWKKPHGRFDRWDKSVVLELGPDPTPTFHLKRGDQEGKAMKTPLARAVTEIARTLHRKYASAMSASSWSVLVSGDLLVSVVEP
jgi:predicted nucleotidyltransferase